MFTLNLAVGLLAGSFLAQAAPTEKRQTSCQAIDYIVNGGFEQGQSPWGLNSTEIDENYSYGYATGSGASAGGGGSYAGGSGSGSSAGGSGGGTGGGGAGGSSSASITKLKSKKRQSSSPFSISSPGAPATGAVVGASSGTDPAAGSSYYELVISDDSYEVGLYQNLIQTTPFGGTYTLTFSYNFINVTGELTDDYGIGYLYIQGYGLSEYEPDPCGYNSGSPAASKRSAGYSCGCDYSGGGGGSGSKRSADYSCGYGPSGGSGSGSKPQSSTSAAPTPVASAEPGKEKRQSSSDTYYTTERLGDAHEIKGHKESSSWKTFETEIVVPTTFAVQQLAIGIDLYENVGITFGFDQISFKATC